MGEHQYSETPTSDHVHDHEIDVVFRHENFTAAVDGNDIAIIRLKEPVVFNSKHLFGFPSFPFSFLNRWLYDPAIGHLLL